MAHSDDAPPVVLDIDGTLTDERSAVDPRVFDALREWPAPVVLATGKALPYPVALCQFVGIPTRVIAENGGIVCFDTEEIEELVVVGDRAAAERVAERYREAGHGLGWGAMDLTNRWRETELAVNRDSPLEPLREFAAAEGLRVFDTGFAYHVTSPDVDKGRGLETAADRLGCAPADFVAVGDSENDAATFRVAGASYAVANADATAKREADFVTRAAYAEGFLEALEAVGPGSDAD